MDHQTKLNSLQEDIRSTILEALDFYYDEVINNSEEYKNTYLHKIGGIKFLSKGTDYKIDKDKMSRFDKNNVRLWCDLLPEQLQEVILDLLLQVDTELRRIPDYENKEIEVLGIQVLEQESEKEHKFHAHNFSIDYGFKGGVSFSILIYFVRN